MAFDKTSPVMQRQTALNTCRRSRIFESLTTPFLRLLSPIPSFHSIIKNIPTIRCAIFPEMPLCQRALYTQPLSLPACLLAYKLKSLSMCMCHCARVAEAEKIFIRCRCRMFCPKKIKENAKEGIEKSFHFLPASNHELPPFVHSRPTPSCFVVVGGR